MGTVAGLIVTLYRLGLSTAEKSLRTMIPFISSHLWASVGWFVVLALLAAAVARLMQFESDTRGSGIPQTDVEVMGRLDMSWPRVIVAKLAEGVICTLWAASHSDVRDPRSSWAAWLARA